MLSITGHSHNDILTLLTTAAQRPGGHPIVDEGHLCLRFNNSKNITAAHQFINLWITGHYFKEGGPVIKSFGFIPEGDLLT